MTRLYLDRREAGVALAQSLTSFAHRDDVVVLGLPRGGVPVAYEVAQVLRAPLDVFVVRKLGMPGHSELAMGAIASGGVRVLNDDVMAWGGRPSEAELEAITRREQLELRRREREYRGTRAATAVAGKVVILVDDGLATGASMRAAVQAARALAPARVVVAVPVGAPETCRALAGVADAVVCPLQPEGFGAVGAWYRDFTQTTDAEVQRLLAAAAADYQATRVPNR